MWEDGESAQYTVIPSATHWVTVHTTYRTVCHLLQKELKYSSSDNQKKNMHFFFFNFDTSKTYTIGE